MGTLERMNGSIARWNLLDSKFYQAWSAGTLPVSALKAYAKDYGAFIAEVPVGWAVHGDDITAKTETGHVALWQEFASALETEISEPEHPEVKALVELSKEAFSRPASALGALYAFEVQQPRTARPKLDGLKAHYNLPASAEAYFEVHVNDDEEVALLEERIAALSPEESAVAERTCESVSKALRIALDGLYESEAAHTECCR